MKRNRFIKLTNAKKSVNRELEAKAHALAGWKGYITNPAVPRPDYVIGAWHQLWQQALNQLRTPASKCHKSVGCGVDDEPMQDCDEEEGPGLPQG